MNAFAFCESATGIGRWHIRRLDDSGLKEGGGITTPSLCGLVKPWKFGGIGGWDLRVAITEHHLGHACPKCVEAYRAVPETRPHEVKTP